MGSVGDEAMKLPTRMLDLSSSLDNDTVLDHPFMRPKIEYRTNAENAPMLLNNFPGFGGKTYRTAKVGRSNSCNSPRTMERIWMRPFTINLSLSTENE
jgi:hypothetical protein